MEFVSRFQCMLTADLTSVFTMGTFRLLAHAAYLVGQVIKQDPDPSSQLQFTTEGFLRLCRTICSFFNALRVEGREWTYHNVGQHTAQSHNRFVSIISMVFRKLMFIVRYSYLQLNFLKPSMFGKRQGDIYLRIYPWAREFLQEDIRSAYKFNPFLFYCGFHVFCYYHALHRREWRLENQKALWDLEQHSRYLTRRKLEG